MAMEIEKTLKNAEAEELGLSINGFLSSVEKLSGKYIHMMHKNMKAMQPHMEAVKKTRESLVDKYAQKDEETGQLKTEKNEDGNEEYCFENDEMKEGFTKDWNEVLEETARYNFHRVPMSVFEEMTFSTQEWPFIDKFMDILLDPTT